MIPMQGGVVAAFGLVRGSAQADMLQLSAPNPITQDLLAQVGFQNEGCDITMQSVLVGSCWEALG